VTAHRTDRRKRVLELRREGLSYRAIGERLGISAARCQQLAAREPETVGRYLERRRRETEAHAATVEAMLAMGLLE
jgi:DNA-directed RNA polymerase specialized sigma24 family protein